MRRHVTQALYSNTTFGKLDTNKVKQAYELELIS